MAQNEMVEDIVGKRPYEQLNQLTSAAKITSEEIVKLSKNAKAAFDELGNSKTLLDLVNASQKAQKANTEMAASVGELGKTYKAANIIMAEHNGHSKEVISNMKGLEAANKTLAQANTENAKTTLLSAKASTENAKQKEIETRYTIALTKEKERLDAAAAKEQANLAKQQSAYAQLSKEYNVAARAAQDLAARQYMLQRDVSAGVEVPKNKAELARLGPQLAEAQANALKLHTALLAVDQAVGKSQRNVGNYNSAQFAMSQLLREAPSFAYNFSTGLMALSNNIPILVDEINRMKVANEALKASGQSTIPIWKTLMGAITSPVGLITIATAAITIFAARMSMSGGAMSKAEEAAKKYADALKSIDENTGSSASKELAHAEALLEIAKNTSIAMNLRVRAVDQLQDKYPDYLGNLSKEAILAGNTADAMERLNNAMVAKATMDAGIEKIGLVEKKIIDFKKSLIDLDIEYEKQAGEVRKAGFSTSGSALEGMYNDMQRKKAEINKMIADAVKERDAFAKIVNEEAAKAGGLIIDQPDKPKKDKREKDYTLKNENDLTQELYAEYAKRLQIEAEGQKAIADDETKSLQERLMAYRQYQELMFQSQAEGLSAQMDVVDNSLKEIEKIEKISADKRTNQQKELLASKAVLLQKYNNISAEYNLLEAQNIEKTAKGVVALQQEEVNKRIDAIKNLTSNVEIQEAQAQQALVISLKIGTIKYQQYTREKKQIEDKFQKEKYQQIVDYLTLEIASLAAQGVDTRKMQEQLNAALKHLYDADTQNFLDAQKEKQESAKKVEDVLKQAVHQSIETNKAFVDAYYEKQISYEESLIAAIEERKQAEIDRINNTMQSEDKKAKQIQALNAQTAAQEKQINAEIRRLKRQQAIADRAAAVLGVVENTAVAVASALKEKWPMNLVLSLIYAGIGTAQVAAIFAQPLPQYGKGTPKDDIGHPGGPAIIGDKPEYVFEPGKPGYFTDKTHVKNLARHTRVIPQEELVANSIGLMTPSLLSGIMINGQTDYSALQDEIKKGNDRIADAINNKPVPSWHATGGEWRKIVRRGNSKTEYLNQNFS